MKNLFQPTWTSLALVVGLIATAWTMSSIGYYQLAGLLGKPGGYNEGPRVFALYYGIWCLVVFAIFHPALSAWAKRSSPPEDRIALFVMLTACALFTFAVLPFLPAADIPTEESVNEIIIAEPWYFLPKTIEILFQQILMTALVVALAAQKLRIGQIAFLTAVLFGGFHLTLALDGANPFYVLRYTIAATLFGAVTPYQMLKMRNGFVYSFALHWGWYAFDTMVWRFVFPET
ncbi:hypothetical protein [Litoreibacter janthinus]|uniref:CAAX protease self-immunity n=1 Tax=Litoreibacter janthinus TaxID=670154 RepID=A0A1I6H531_9RHOB|nr:hypothetical protein [Litoreibacter janthinus]SFR49626.1 hypothetical protein SAMN04488002_2541 [Litoreibacter janthinus]